MINLRNAKEYIENFLYIRTKEGELIKFTFNRAQIRFYEELKKQAQSGRPIRIIILKARQLGFSTVTEAVMFQRTATNRNIKTQIIAHREDATANLFKMNTRFLENLPPLIRPMTSASNAQEIVFKNPDKSLERAALNPGLDSAIRCNTAGGAGIGRSDTIQNLHVSEYAFWRGKKAETLDGAMQAVPALPGTIVVIESTANGFDDFKKMWDAAVAGENDYVPLFFPWYDNPDYTKTPPNGFKLTDGEKEIKARFHLTNGQMYWRRWCIRNNCHGDERTFRQEYPATPDEAFLTTGTGIFDNEVVMACRQKGIKPVSVGEFEYDYDEVKISNIRWVERPDGCVRIYRQPKKRQPYVLGGDTAGEGSDWFSGFVIDNITSEQCAVLHKQYGEPEYARQMYCMGMYYNTALIGCENNFSTYPTQELDRLKYPKLYNRERPDNYTGRLADAYGWVTSLKTRPVMIANLAEMFKQHPELFEDYALLGEMLTFCRNEDGRPEALEGEHDDLVMGLAITYEIRNQQVFTQSDKALDMSRWTADMIEDYERADPQEKEYLLKIWRGYEKQKT